MKILEKKSEEVFENQNVGLYLVYEELWPRGKNSFEIVQDILSDFEPLDLILTLSKIGVIMRDSFYKPVDREEQGLIGVLLNSVERKKVGFWMQSGRRIKFIVRQSLLAAIQIAILQSHNEKKRHPVAGNTHKLGEALLRLNSFLEKDFQIRQSSSLDERRVVAAMALRMIMFNHRLSVGPSIGRYWAIIKKGLPAVKIKYQNQYFDMEGVFNKLFNFTFEQMLGQVFAIWGHYSNKGFDQILNDPKEFLLGEGYFKYLNPEARSKSKAVFDYLGIDLSGLCKIVEKEISNFSLPNHYAFSAFWDHPVLSIGKGAFFPIDLLFLESKMTQGVYWSLFNKFLKENETEKMDLLRETFGHAIEWYAGQHLEEAVGKTSNQRYLWLEWNGDVEGVDAVVRENDTLFLIEITSSGLTYRTR